MSNQPPDYYEVLKVDRTATRREIARAYRALMRLHHPDVDGTVPAGRGTGNGGKADGGSGLLDIMEAFAVLGDPKTRAAYDRTMSVPTTRRGGPIEVPVRHVHAQQPPLLRVSPVLWERGPKAGSGQREPDKKRRSSP